MFRIGEFSRIGRVTIETLRHYDACGLLKPAHVDRSTGYRYYVASQLSQLNKIVALKDVGFSLEEISRIFREDLTIDQLRGMLQSQLIMAEREMEQAKLRQERIQARLNYLDLEKDMPVYDVTLKSIDAIPIASLREIVPAAAEIPGRWGAMFTTIAMWLGEHKIPSGPAITIYHNEGHTLENIDTECAFTMPNAILDRLPEPSTPMMVRQTIAYEQVATTVVPDYTAVDGLGGAYNALGRWLQDHRYSIIGAPREIYFGAPGSGENAVEIQFPVGKCEVNDDIR